MLTYMTGPFISALNDFPCARVQIIGHSLGGVMAELFVSSATLGELQPVHVKQAAFFKPGTDLEVITFAKSRIGNQAWADYLNSVSHCIPFWPKQIDNSI
jgi:Lipase (class 3)